MGGLVLGLVAVLAGCGGGGSPASAPSSSSSSSAVAALPEVPGISAEAVRLRTDVAIGRQLQVRVRDTGTAPFTVTSVQLDSAGFAVLPTRELSAEFTPGRVIDLTVPYGAVRCSASPDPAAARLTVLRPDGAVEELRVPLAGSTIAQLYDDDCAVEGVLAVVDVAVEGLSAAGEALTGDVVLTRRGDGDEVLVSALYPSVVLQPVPDVDLPVRLAAGDRELRLPVSFDAGRCDAHALAETKQPFVFPLMVAVGDGRDVAVDLPLDDPQKLLLQEFLGRVCR
jgi:hypothetical protein